MNEGSKHLSGQDLDRYRDRQMSPEELLRSGDHLAQCAQCASQIVDDDRAVMSAKLVRAVLQDPIADETNHLAFEQISNYIDDLLSPADREIVDEHLASCEPCTEEVNELYSEKLLVDASESKKYAPKHLNVQRPSSIQKLFRAYRVPILIAGTAALIVMLVWIATLPLRSEIVSLRAQLDQVQRTNDDLSSRVSAVHELESQIAQLRQDNQELHDRGTADLLIEIKDTDGRITIDRQGNLTGVESLGETDKEAVKTALLKQRIEVGADVSALRGKAGELMGTREGSESFGVVAPVGESVEADHPTFRWRPVSGATAYVVSVYAPHFQLVSTSGQITGTEWTSTVALQRGKVYSWQVRALVDDKEIVSPPPQSPEAKFKVLDSVKLAELQRVRQSYGKSHLVLAIVYARMGLLDDSEREVRSLLSADPKSKVLQGLLRSISSKR